MPGDPQEFQSIPRTDRPFMVTSMTSVPDAPAQPFFRRLRLTDRSDPHDSTDLHQLQRVQPPPFEGRHMTAWKKIAIAAAVVAGAGAALALAPVAYGQKALRVSEGQPQVFELFGGSSRVGISVKDLTDEEVKRSKLSSASGALVSDVEDDSPAATAGFRANDVVVEFDGERIRSARQLTRLVQETPSGRAVQAVVVRDGQRVTLTITPRESSARPFDQFRDFEEFGRKFRYELPPTPPARPAPTPRPPRPPLAPDVDEWVFGRSSSRLGITVDDLSEQLASYFGTKDGVLVTTVRDDSAAAKAGLKAGDVITQFNGSPIDSPAELRRSIQRLDDDAEFTVDIVRDRKPMTLKGTVAPREDRRRTYRSIV
jgi:serine protease Do